jgi:DHA1 family bicyclomycin/chloramphenicol resistance-like MFS transporter
MVPSRLRLTFILGALTAFAPMSIDMYLPSLPALAREFGATAASAQLTLSAFFLGLALGQALYGPLADRFGRKPPLYVGLSLYVVASAGCALATSIEALVALRFIQALGGCAGVVVARAVVRDLFDQRGSARMLSRMMLVMGAAPMLAPLAGGWLAAAAGWRAIFWTLCGFGIACIAVTFTGMPETRPGFTVRPGVGAALRGYARLLAHRRFLGYTFAGGFAQAGMFAYISGSPFVFIDVYGVPAQAYGWLFGLNALGLIAASQLNARLVVRLGPDRLLARANAANALFGLALLAAAWTGAGGFAGLLVPLFGYVASLGFSFPNAAAGAMAPFPEQAGSASALLGTVQFAIAAVAGATVGVAHDGTAFPMAAVIAVCGVSAFAVQRLLIPARP